MKNEIVVGTSLAPYDIEKQVSCVKTWIIQGIKVVVFNTAEEIVSLKKHFNSYDISFLPIQRDAYSVSGKHLPFIQDILDYTSEASSKICGYINSDLYLDYFDENLYRFICEESIGSVVIVHRHEINALGDQKRLDYEINSDGIDAFFVDKALADGLMGDESYVQTTWDFFLIAHCRRKRINVKTLFTPVFFHQRHKVRWDYKRIEKSFELLSENYYGGQKTWRDLFYERYETYFDYSTDIVYSSGLLDNILVVADASDREYIEDFCEKHLSGKKFSVESNTGDSKIANVVISIPKGIRLRDPFFEFVDFILEKYNVSKLVIGPFFSSFIEGKHIYNQLNRSVQLLNELDWNEEFCISIQVNRHREKGNDGLEKARIIYPICYRDIDLSSDYVIKKRIDAPLYIFPAGYSSGLWYAINKEHLSIDITGFLDSDIGKDGLEMAGKRIFQADKLLNLQGNMTIIVCSKYYYNEIHSKLEMYSFENYIDGDKILYINNGIVYYFDQRTFEKNFVGSLYET